MEDSLGEGLRSFFGVHIINAIRDPLGDPEAFVEAAAVVDALQLYFSCPSCRSVMRRRPIPAVAVREIIGGLGLGDRSEVEAATTDQLRQANDAFERCLLF